METRVNIFASQGMYEICALISITLLYNIYLYGGFLSWYNLKTFID